MSEIAKKCLIFQKKSFLFEFDANWPHLCDVEKWDFFKGFQTVWSFQSEGGFA